MSFLCHFHFQMAEEDSPAWNTRSSQTSQRAHSQDEPENNLPDSRENSIYEITLLPLVKNTVGERNTSAVKLSVFVFGGASWSAIKASIFEKFKTKCHGLAHRDDAGVWSVRDEQVTEDDFASIFSMKLGSHVKKFDSDVGMQDWLVSTRSQRVTLSIYKYGNEIGTKQQLTEFNATCIAPSNQDRSGAPNESTIQEFMAKLHSKWDSMWEADSPIWRLWATHVVRPPMLAWETRVRQEPPPHILSRLRHTTSIHELRYGQAHRSTRTSLEIVDGSLLQLEQLKATVDIVVQRMQLFQEALVAKREILVGMERELAPIPPNELPIPVLDASRNNPDVDHDFAVEDATA
ncbi:hypothetical protein DYB36_013118 [Aphanomyces astaci]|uniref:Uncharacterized protein n=1 Tax=Aphanomyces astaci TaxID=112090 RepID=A0A396ZZ52_APHAT|nr:hypothetical protein DYB36_013118 [Aphanomyces astaci]